MIHQLWYSYACFFVKLCVVIYSYNAKPFIVPAGTILFVRSLGAGTIEGRVQLHSFQNYTQKSIKNALNKLILNNFGLF